eukprot:11437254-Ditylum_brightwellii.AAC.1
MSGLSGYGGAGLDLCLVDKGHDGLFFVALLEKSVVKLFDEEELVFLILAENDNALGLPKDNCIHNSRWMSRVR